ncbi:hypothetical protein VZT92_003893 [Zoarces viviparus]|uniref:Uncharacterized protein n=1 Tax=Zoarces viviparus TaxID=48416 RepID=A0AAW1FX56_ZOAVI
MTNLIRVGAQSAQDEEGREGELLCLKIKAQLEDLLSERHLAEDGFLLKHVQKNKRGYKFSPYGSITTLWILYPGKTLPNELQRYAKYHKELGQHLCAVVRFDHLVEVRKASNALRAEEKKSNGEGMRVVPLGRQSMHHVTKDEPSEENNKDQPEDPPSQENPPETSQDPVQEEPSAPVKVSDTCQPQKPLDNSMQRTFEQISTSHNSQSSSGWNQRYSQKSWCSADCDNENSQSPWVLSRKSAASALNPKGFHSREKPPHHEELTPSLGSSNTTCAE